jgi:hypothetical protein
LAGDPARRLSGTAVTEAYIVIRNALLNRQQVVATYHGHPREMCPHILGTKDGREAGLFYQFGGSSSSGLGPYGSPENWRCMFIDELQDVTVRDGRWHTARSFELGFEVQSCVDWIDVQVSL